MKIHTTRDRLSKAVQLSERITGKKESLPVLSCILIETSNHDITIKATNLEAGIEVRCAAEIEEQGSVAVSAGILSQTLRSVQGEKVTLYTEEHNLIIESRGSKTLIKAVPHDEFPSLPVKGGSESLSVPRVKLLEGLQAVMYAASVSMIRPELGSVLVSISEDGLVCAATDSFRLAEKQIPNIKSVSNTVLLVPLRHVTEVVYVLEHVVEDTVSINIDDSQMVVEAGGARFISRIIDGSFPNYREIIPKTFVTEAVVLKSDLTEMLRKARIFSGSEQNVGLHIYPAKKKFTATARSADVGEMSDSVEAALSGEDIDINFHIGYIADCLSSVASDSVSLSFVGAGRPLVIRGVGDASLTYLVMPLNR